jgi:hypothetical protein
MDSSTSKRRRGSDDYAKQQQQQPQVSCCRPPRRKQHLYLALDHWKGGYSIHKLDADDILDQQQPPAAAAAAAGELLKLIDPGRRSLLGSSISCVCRRSLL